MVQIWKELKFQVYYGSWALVCLVFFMFLVANALSSQMISPLYFKVVNEERVAVVSFLQDMRKQPEYNQLLGIQERIFKTSLKDDIYAEEISRKQTAGQLEEWLKHYPNDPDLLVGLAKIYNAQGNTAKSQSYLKQAKALDPEAKL